MKLSLGQHTIRIYFCHKIPERSFKILNKRLPICSRCTGLFVGLLFIPFSLFFRFLISFPISILFTLPIAIDGFSQLIGLRKSNNILRFLTSLLFTIGYYSVIMWFR